MKLSLRKHRPAEPGAPAPVETPPCPHVALVPRWDSADDMGHDDRATEFRCESCGAVFSPSDAQALRRSERERLESSIGGTNAITDEEADPTAQ